jgi:hypothetical protein
LQKTWLCAAKFQFDLAHQTVWWCTGQCPVRQAGPRELAALGIRRLHLAKIHRTVQWCTGLTGELTVASANGRLQNLRAMRGSSNGRHGHRTVRCAPDSVRCANGLGATTVDCARFGRQSCTGQATVAVRWRTRLSGAPLARRQGWPSKFAFNGS